MMDINNNTATMVPDNQMEPDFMAQENKLKVDVFSFNDYRDYLKAVSDEMRLSRPQFSHRFFAREAGFGSPSYLLMVISGKRNMSPASISKCARALKLNKRETEYFEAMAFYNQSKTGAEKDRYLEVMLSIKPRAKMASLAQDRFEYFTNSLFVIVREMAALPDFKEDTKWINRRLRRPAKPAEIKHALVVLERLKLLVRDEKGRLKHSGMALQSPIDAESIELVNYHRQILAETKDAILSLPHKQWDIAALTVPMDPKALPKVMEMMDHFREEVVEFLNKEGRDCREIYHLNMQLFPVTHTPQDGNENE